MSVTKVKKSGSQGRKILDRIEKEKKAKGGKMKKSVKKSVDGVAYLVKNIKWDTSGKRVNLPGALTIVVPYDVIGYYETDQYISDAISNKTGFTHKGFDTIPEIPDDEQLAKGGVMSKYQQAKEKWDAIESRMTPNQKKIFKEIYDKGMKERPDGSKLYDSLTDESIAEYINGGIQEWEDYQWEDLKPTDITTPFFNLGFKFIAYNDAIEEPEFYPEMAKGGVPKPKGMKYSDWKNSPERQEAIDRINSIKDEDLDAEIARMEKELGVKGNDLRLQEGGETKLMPYPIEDATTLEVGVTSMGSDGNMWEVQKDYQDINRWVKAQVVESIEPVVEIITEVVESKKLTEIQQGLLEKGFINEDLTLTNKGQRIVELHKFCFPLEVHPFSHIYYGLDRLYPNNKSVYLLIDRATMFTGENQEYFEIVEHIPTSISDKSVYDADLESRIAEMKGEKIKFIPYSYCPAIDDEKTGVGFIVFGNMENTNELHINAGIYNYAMKVHEIDGWKADSDKAVFVYGYEGRKLKVVIKVQEQLIGLHDRVGMFNRDNVLEKIKSNYAKLFIKGEDIVKFETEKKQDEDESLRQQTIQLIKSWEELIEMTDDKEEKKMYKEEIKKLKKQN